jgi:hypothetical protein
VSEPTYTITITESQRTALARDLGLLVTKLVNAPIFVESESGGTAAARSVLSPPQQASPAAAPSPTPVDTVRDRWARDRKGNEQPNPEGVEAFTVRLVKAERKDLESGAPRMKVAFPGVGRGFIDANCFDEKLFPWLAAGTKNGKDTTIYIVKKDKYKNIVGVRA